MISGSARLPRIEGMASLRHTSQLRRHTATKRRLRTGGAKSLARSMSVAQVAPGQLEEHILQVGRAMQVSELALPAQARDQRCDVFRVAEDRIAGALDARRETPRVGHPLLHSRAVYLEHLCLDVPGDQRARAALGDDPAAV